MKKIVSLLIVILISVSLVQAKTWKKVRIATEGAWPPFNEVNKDGEIVGFEIDYANLLCKKMKVECTIVAQDWDGIIPGLMAKKYDAIVASMSITDERKQTIAFSKGYYTTPAKFIAPKGTLKEISPKTLKGLSVAVQRATIHENYMNDNYKGIAKINSYGTIEEAYLDLQAGRVDVVFADSVTLEFGFFNDAANKAKYGFVPGDFTDRKWFGDGVGIGLRKSDSDLKKMFDKAIEKTYKDGSFDKLNDKYFNFNIGMP